MGMEVSALLLFDLNVEFFNSQNDVSRTSFPLRALAISTWKCLNSFLRHKNVRRVDQLLFPHPIHNALIDNYCWLIPQRFNVSDDIMSQYLNASLPVLISVDGTMTWVTERKGLSLKSRLLLRLKLQKSPFHHRITTTLETSFMSLSWRARQRQYLLKTAPYATQTFSSSS